MGRRGGWTYDIKETVFIGIVSFLAMLGGAWLNEGVIGWGSIALAAGASVVIVLVFRWYGSGVQQPDDQDGPPTDDTQAGETSIGKAVLLFGGCATLAGLAITFYLYVDATLDWPAVAAMAVMTVVTALSTLVAWRRR